MKSESYNQQIGNKIMITRRNALKSIGGSVGIAGLGSIQTATARDSPHPIIGDEVVIVPLDDRPANIYFPKMTAATAGIETRYPPDEMIGYFERPGNGEAIGEWLRSVDGIDGYIISADMLAYGGLIASRTPDLSRETALANIEILTELENDNPDLPLYVYDTIQRLAPTELGEADFNPSLVREWAILYDRVENFGQEEYEDDLAEVRSQIPDEILDEYLAARARNHIVNRRLIELTAAGTVDQLVLGQDDAAEYGLHRAEREDLIDLINELGVSKIIEVFPGADEIDVSLVSRYVYRRLGTTAKLAVDYAGIHGSDWIAPLEDISFDENIRRHLDVSGAEVVEDGADIELMVNTPSPEGNDRQEDIDSFVSRIVDHQRAGSPVIIVDPVYTNRADSVLMDRLESEAAVANVLSYSGWNTAGNALGIATGHGLSRWTFLQRSWRKTGVPELTESTAVHVEYLLHRLILDDYWKNVVQPAAYEKGRGMGANIWNLDPDEAETLEAYVRDEIIPFTTDYFAEHFEGNPIEFGHRGNRTFEGEIAELKDVGVTLPWPRLFETRLEPDISVTWRDRTDR